MKRTAAIEAYIRSNNMLEAGDTVCVGLSGGADSVCLFLFLLELSPKLKTRLAAFHVNHGLRGEESDRDEQFVRELCTAHNVPLFTYRADVRAVAEKMSCGLEEAGRNVRKQAAAETLKKTGGNKIALAHNKNDCCETVLFNLSRGSSLKGLSGIAPVSGNTIRPVLCLSRSEIEDELSALGQPFRVDSTNLEDEYTRNKIRHHILPLLEKDINPAACEHIFSAARDLREAAEYMEAVSREKYAKYVSCGPDGGFRVSEKLADEPEIISGNVLLDVIKAAKGSGRDVARKHIDEVRALIGKKAGSRADLPGGIFAVKEYGRIVIGRSVEKSFSEEILLNTDGITKFEACGFASSVIKKSDFHENIIENRYTKFFDYDKIERNVVIRHRKNGDFLTVTDAGAKKKLSDYLINEKVPAADRDGIICLAAGRHIIWIVGMRISSACKITDSTQRILKVEFLKRSQL